MFDTLDECEGIDLVLLVLSESTGLEMASLKEAIMGPSVEEEERMLKMEQFLGKLHHMVSSAPKDDGGIVRFHCDGTHPELKGVLHSKNAKYRDFIRDALRFQEAVQRKVYYYFK